MHTEARNGCQKGHQRFHLVRSVDAEGKCETEGEAVEESAEQTFKLPLDPCEEDGSCSSEDEMVC